MVARHQKESRQVQARSGNETYYRYLDTDSERLVTSAIDCATGQLSGAATAEPYPNNSIFANLHERNHLAGAFFCRRDDPNLGEPINILPSFIHKLAIIFPPFRTIVAKHLRDDPNLTPESMQGSLFLDFIRSLPRHPEHTLVFVVDALDECGDAQSRPRILKVLTNAAAHASWLKIIFTSRTEVDIQHLFGILTESSYVPYELG